MKLSFKATIAQLKVFSAVCSNLAVLWLVAAFATRDVLVLTTNASAAILSLLLAIRAEELLEELNYD